MTTGTADATTVRTIPSRDETRPIHNPVVVCLFSLAGVALMALALAVIGVDALVQALATG